MEVTVRAYDTQYATTTLKNTGTGPCKHPADPNIHHWGSVSHQVCVVDQHGLTLGEKAFNHMDKGLNEMAQWLIELSRSTADGKQ